VCVAMEKGRERSHLPLRERNEGFPYAKKEKKSPIVREQKQAIAEEGRRSQKQLYPPTSARETEEEVVSLVEAKKGNAMRKFPHLKRKNVSRIPHYRA